ncbi:MAG: PhzF family phenazine biosynthesis protein [Halocynthiibacter sp.]
MNDFTATIRTPGRIAAFANGDQGGNPAGVVLGNTLPAPDEMQRIAADLGYSETVFAAPDKNRWKVRYYSPEDEVPFCGHATIALGAILGENRGAGIYHLDLAEAQISVSTQPSETGWQAALQSPETWSDALDETLLQEILDLFGLTSSDLNPQLPPRLGFAGNRHAILALKSRDTLARMAYDFDAGKTLMERENLITISLLYVETPTLIHARNAFAIGGVVEDPATGAAAAALGGVLVDMNWPGLKGGGHFTIRQGEDMGQPSLLNVEVTGTAGDSVRVSGDARMIEA